MAHTLGRNAALLSVLLGATILGFAPIGLRLSELGPQATAFWRFALALPLLAALYALSPRDRPTPLQRIDLGLLVVAGACFGLDMALYHLSLTLTTVANATLLSNMTPILTATAGYLLFRERLGPFAIAGIAVAVAGAVILTLARGAAGQGALVGDALSLAAAFWYAIYLIVVNRVRRSADLATVMLVTTASAALVALAATLVAGERLWPHTAAGWTVLAALGLIVHVGGQGLIARGLGALPIALATVALWVQPIAAAGLSWVLFGEKVTLWMALGAVLVFAGIYGVRRDRL